MNDHPSEPRRRAETIFPPNDLKAKTGSGGLDEELIARAQTIIDTSPVDFIPLGQRYLASLQEGLRITRASRGQIDDEALIATMIYPAMQLKANGGMFHYPLITAVAARLILFLEYLREPNDDALEVVGGFFNSLSAILMAGEPSSTLSERGDDLYAALDEACERFFEKHGY